MRHINRDQRAHIWEAKEVEQHQGLEVNRRSLAM